MKFFQRLGRSLMLPVAVLPVAAILSGIGYWIKNANGGADNIGSAFLSAAGGALLDNLALLFAVGVSIGMAKKSDGTLCRSVGRSSAPAAAQPADRRGADVARTGRVGCGRRDLTPPGAIPSARARNTARCRACHLPASR